MLKIKLREPSPEDFIKANSRESKGISSKEPIQKTLLTNDEIQQLYKRSKPIKSDPSDKKRFFKREKTLPAPRKGEIIKQSFPPKVQMIKPAELEEEEKKLKKELKVLRYMPEGKNLNVVPQIVVTFNHPMVPLTSVDKLKDMKVPVKLLPKKLKGEWRWIGTKTVKFKPTCRLPKSTNYSVTIPKGIKSELGVVLEKDVNFKFTTKPIEYTMYPTSYDKIGMDGIICCTFNQKINKKKIVNFLSVVCQNNRKAYEIKVLKKDEVRKMIDESDMKKKLRNLWSSYDAKLENGIDEEILWFKFKEKLVLNSQYTVTIRKGCDASLEGPRKTEKDQKEYFETYGPMVVLRRYPKADKDCVPMSSWSITFSNNIELDDFNPDESMIKITPKLENRKITAHGQNMTITGKSKGRTTYTVEFLALKDVYGQFLKKGTKEKFKVGSAAQNIYGFHSNTTVVLDPTIKEEPTFSVVSVNVKEIRVCIFQVRPSDYHSSFLGNDYHYHRKTGSNYDPSPEESINAGKKVFDKVINIKYKEDDIVETVINLKDHLQFKKECLGQLALYVEPTLSAWSKGEYRYRPRIQTWVQVTRLAVDAHSTSGGEVYCFSTSLLDGKSIDGTKFTLQRPAQKKIKDYKNMQISTVGDKDGLGFFSGLTKYGSIVFAEKDKDICFVSGLNYCANRQSYYLNYIANDRGLYKPKETVSIKGIIRYLKMEGHDRSLVVPKRMDLKFEVFDARGNKFKSGKVNTNEYGSFFVKVDLPDNINLGQCRFTCKNKKVNLNHYFKVQEFRTPEFSSSATVDPGPYIVNNIAIVTGKAEYFSGGGLSGSESSWNVSQNATTYFPTGFSFKGFSFSSSYNTLKEDGSGILLPTPENPKPLKGSTDSKGEHKCCVDFKDDEKVIIKKPISVTTNFVVQDINRQTMQASTSFIVHPSKLYVGLKLGKCYSKVGEPLPIDFVVTDVDGKIVKDVEVELKIIKRFSEQKGYQWIQKDKTMEVLKLKSGDKPTELDLKIKEGGTFFMLAKLKDKDGLENYSSCSIWIAGGVEIKKKGSKIEMEEVKMIANQKTYKVGEEAKILITTPFEPPCSALMCVYGNNGFAKKEKFDMKESSQIVKVKIDDRSFIPNIMVKVYLSGMSQRVDEKTGRETPDAPKRPAFATGTCTLEIPPSDEEIEIEITPNKKIMKPGEKGECLIQLKGKDIKNSVVSMIIVDEAVLSLTGYKLPHPISSFYPRNYPTVYDHYLRSLVFVKDWSGISIEGPPEPPCEGEIGGFGGGGGYGGRRGGGGGRFCECCLSRCCCGVAPPPCCSPQCCRAPCRKCKKGGRGRGRGRCTGRQKCCCETSANSDSIAPEQQTAIEVRTNFKPLACFVSDQKTDKDGKAVIKFELPDNLTRYRVWVLATKGTDFYGLGESSIQAQLPVNIRPSIPRFLNFGDKSYFTVVVQNQTLKEITVNVCARMTNLKFVNEKERGFKVVIPYTRRAELRFNVETKSCGKGRFQVIAAVVGTNFADAAEKEIPIFTPSTSEAFATYGEVDNDGVVIQSILPPPKIYNEFGGLVVTTSSTALQALTDAFIYLLGYQFDCLEQISSRIMSIFALQDILYAFNVPKIPSKAKLKKIVEAGLKKIKANGRSDGGFGFWTLRSEINIYLSIHIAHCLIRGLEQGYKVDNILLNRSKSFCRQVENHIQRQCSWYGPYSKASLRSFALYVLAIYDQNKKLSSHEKGESLKQALSLHKGLLKYLTMEGKAWLIFAINQFSKEKAKHPIVKGIMKEFMNNVNETPETANFITSYGDNDGKLVMLHSNRRTDGVILEVLITIEPKSYLIPKIVKGLLAHKKKGRWNSTQENIYILIALKKYFKIFEKVVPDFVCRMWLGEDYGGEVKFKGRETDYKVIEVPMKVIIPDDSKDGVKKDLCLSKKGKGRLYYRLGMNYAPKSLKLKAIDYGFIVERTYEGVTEKEHVSFDKKKDCWVFKAGELIRVKLKLSNNSRRYHVALVDFLPAGCEVLNPELKGTVTVPEDEKKEVTPLGGCGFGMFSWRWFWYRPWYEHQNLRDERVEVFSSYLYCGEHEFSYLMRATSFGEYVIPPCKAEEMYSPELFGRSRSEKCIIKD